MIRLQNFSYRYPDSPQKALQDVCLEVGRGELVLLTGPSGCGKSTLFLALAGFLFARYDGEHSGTVDVAGRDPSREPVYATADVVGLVQQNPEDLFCTLTVEDEIAFGLENRLVPREEIERRMDWALEAVGAAHLRERELFSLSGGEKQRIALAAVLAPGPEVILFDEPTSGLDPRAAQEIFRLLLDLQRREGLTMLVAEHKQDFLQHAHPRRLYMEHGRLLSTDEVSRKKSISSHWRKPPAAGETETTSMFFTLNIDPAAAMAEPIMEACALTAGYESKTVVQAVDLQLFPGEFVCLLGDSGSGKSTLLLTLLGLIPLMGGTVRFQGCDIAALEPGSLHRQTGIVFQNPDHQLFAPTVWQEAVLAAENFGLSPEQYEDFTRDLLESAGLGDRLEDHPHRLSFGQKRRLNLVSVLCFRPRILFLDEVYTGQDPDNMAVMHSLLSDYVEQGNSVVLVNHDPEYSARAATRLLFLRDGRLVVDSPTASASAALRELGETVYLPGGAL